jgi:hypothetical protein
MVLRRTGIRRNSSVSRRSGVGVQAPSSLHWVKASVVSVVANTVGRFGPYIKLVIKYVYCRSRQIAIGTLLTSAEIPKYQYVALSFVVLREIW